jgi:periplasmic divalent cation tolerance protein
MDNVYIIVLVTTASKHEAEEIVQHLLGDKLIACGNIVGPVTSFFRWSGNVERAEEFLVLMKTRRDLFQRLSEVVKTLHSYEVPEILAVPVVEGSIDYMEWFHRLCSCLLFRSTSQNDNCGDNGNQRDDCDYYEQHSRAWAGRCYCL